jgi:hypothetical protein
MPRKGQSEEQIVIVTGGGSNRAPDRDGLIGAHNGDRRSRNDRATRARASPEIVAVISCVAAWDANRSRSAIHETDFAYYWCSAWSLSHSPEIVDEHDVGCLCIHLAVEK